MPSPQEIRAIARARAELAGSSELEGQIDALTAEWSEPIRAFYDDPALQVVALKGRRAGATRAGVRHLLRRLARTPGARLLYIIDTREEAVRLVWHGNRQDGILPLCMQLGWVQSGYVKLTESKLTARIPSIDSWLYIFGADDEAGVRKALGGAFHEAWWDEAQKIPPKLAPLIREVFTPTLLDFGGRFRLSGTPVRQMAGLFYDVTQSNPSDRKKGWSYHHFNLLDNPYFGRTREQRWQRGIVELARRLDVPLDAPIILREGLGQWTAEGAYFIYAVHTVEREKLCYAPARVRDDGHFDLEAALADLPGDWHEYIFALGVDIGWDDPFAMVLWAWHPHDPTLYEVISWQQSEMDDDQQADAIKSVLRIVHVSIIAADASGPAKPSVKGWSRKFIEKYQVPVTEAEKSNKRGAIRAFNTDLKRGGIKLRKDGQLLSDMLVLQWSPLVDATGKEVEAAGHHQYTHCPDGGLYGHRMSYAYRGVPPEDPPEKGSPEAMDREERELEEAMEDG